MKSKIRNINKFHVYLASLFRRLNFCRILSLGNHERTLNPRGEGLWEVAIRCHNSYSNAMSNKKHLTDIGDLNFLMCKAIENPQLTPSSSLRTAIISVFEEPVVYETSDLQKALGVEDYVGCASVHGVGPSIAVFDTIRDEQLDCACVYPAPLHSRKQIERVVEHMKRILIEGSSHLDDHEDFVENND
uniref:Uncharacterized protein n=1 Tax=Ananas comosus var. bracteatus TaxID=296719 RepID=A0A6V7NHY9_ANACO|nr:unnamed protein product [Ananas comosus var. bracteatus]